MLLPAEPKKLIPGKPLSIVASVAVPTFTPFT